MFFFSLDKDSNIPRCESLKQIVWFLPDDIGKVCLEETKTQEKNEVNQRNKVKKTWKENFFNVLQDTCADVENVCYDDAAESEEATYL